MAVPRIRLFSQLPTPFFTNICIVFSTSYIYTISESDAWFTFSSQVHVETFGMMWMRRSICTNVYIHTLMWESSITRQDIRDILISFDSGLIYRHVSKSFETRREQVDSVKNETNVPFTLSFSSCLVLSWRECKPDMRYRLNWIFNQHERWG